MYQGSINKSTWEKVLNFIASAEEKTPYLLIDRDVVIRKARLIGKGIDNSKVFYAVKAHPDIEVVRLIDSLDLNFEIASEGELGLLRELGVSPERIISSNPVKSPDFIREAYSYGIRYFAFDSRAEVEKLSLYAPDSSVYVRLSVPNEGSDWPLSKKFGVEPDRALELLLHAKERGLRPVGITFHVGSQCKNIYNWSTALDKVAHIWQSARQEGIQLTLLNIGGGYPIRYISDVVDIAEIEAMVNRILKDHFPGMPQVHIEPGRAVIGDAGVFVTSVIG
ncbi:MAG TPA: type III PLP-dependent enzyme, partial [Nitrospirae bacterium]|nr:type III PLP-dependent enzyme [Nitrospirota bacterium]